MAPEGAIWVCAACGKTSKDLYGINEPHDCGWDESCMMNAILCYEEKVLYPDGIMKYKPYEPFE